MNKTALKNSLIELGAANPSLRPAIRPLLAALAPRVAADEYDYTGMINSMVLAAPRFNTSGSGKWKLVMKIKSANGDRCVAEGKASLKGHSLQGDFGDFNVKIVMNLKADGRGGFAGDMTVTGATDMGDWDEAENGVHKESFKISKQDDPAQVLMRNLNYAANRVYDEECGM